MTAVIVCSPEVIEQHDELQYTDFDDDQTANLLCTLPLSPPPSQQSYSLRGGSSSKNELVLVLPESPTRHVYTKLRQNRKYYREEDEDEEDDEAENDDEQEEEDDDEDDAAIVDEEDDDDYNGPIEESDEEEEDADDDDDEFVETHSRKLAVIERDVQGKAEKSVEVAGDAHWNDRGYEVCGHVNRHGKPCQRIGNCPFHSKSKKSRTKVASQPNGTPTRSPPIKKGPFKQGWTQEEHIRFLKGLQIFGRGSWKEISLIVGTRTPTQIQVHAHRYFLRQKQGDKNKKSIHDFNLHDLAMMEKKTKEKKN